MNDLPTRILFAVALATAALIAGAFAFDTAPSTPLTNAQLAQAMEKDAVQNGESADVTCHTLASPGPDGANRMCRESLMGLFCTVPSTPSLYRIAVRVDGSDYHETERLTESSGDCSVF